MELWKLSLHIMCNGSLKLARCACALLDMSKAFDMIDHGHLFDLLLLHKLPYLVLYISWFRWNSKFESWSSATTENAILDKVPVKCSLILSSCNYIAIATLLHLGIPLWHYQLGSLWHFHKDIPLHGMVLLDSCLGMSDSYHLVLWSCAHVK